MDHPQREQQVVVLVARSGGVAGMTRRWRATPSPDESPRWVALIDECPWDEVPPPERGADRYVWRITVSTDGDRPTKDAQVPESELEGPWRALVDSVQNAAAPEAAR